MHVDGKSGVEEIEDVYCKSHFPIISSHHDVIVSAFSLPITPAEVTAVKLNAPTVPNRRKKIIWSEESLPDYCALVTKSLADLRGRWSQSSSKSCVSLLLQLSAEILSSAASSTNIAISLDCPRSPKAPSIPQSIRRSLN